MNLRLVCLICLVGGYVFGLFQTAYIIGKIKKVDIRKKGSGNLGATNMFRVLGIKSGILTFAGDLLKVFLAEFAAYMIVLVWLKLPIDRVALFLYTGFGVILGHDFPFYLKFKGGKGVAATAAILISIWDWKMVVLGILVFFGIAVFTQYISLGSMCLIITEFIAFIVFTQTGLLELDPVWLIDCYIIIGLMMVLIIVRHRSNIVKLFKGTENKFRFMSENEIKEQAQLVEIPGSSIKTKRNATIAILGGGSWAMALAILLTDNGNNVTMWSAVPSEIDILEKDRTNPAFLPDITLPESVKLTKDINECVNEADVIVMAVASAYTRATAKLLKGLVTRKQKILTVAKGIEDKTFKTLREIIIEELPGMDVLVLSGPSHAEEVARKLPTVVTIAGDNLKKCKYLQDIFASPVFRVYTSLDWRGLELGGALKNVIALAAGIADGLGYGDNLKAALITRGIKEISRLALRLGARYDTLYGLSGIGDLIVTCASVHSRNRRCGYLIGQGMSAEEAVKEVGMVVEGFYSAKAAKALAKKVGIEMPIVNEVNKILFDGEDPRDAVNKLMLRTKVRE